ncbi:MAG: major capsid protein [Candidatus Pristimantibacillus sp.]
MAVTLAEAKKNVQDDLQIGVIDEFRKSNWLLNNLTFDDVVSPTGGGATLTYGYTRLITQPLANFRAINSEYSPGEVTKQRYNADLKVFGGSFQIDRIIANMGGIASEVALQMAQKIKAAQALFNDTVINGDSGVDANSFDGLEKGLAGSSTEFNPSEIIDLSTSAMIDANYKLFLDEMDNFLSLLDGKPSALMMNSKLWAKIRACARRSSMYMETKDDFGRNVANYDGIALVDVGDKAGTSTSVIPIDGTTKETSLYAVRLGLDGFHGISMAGQPPINTWLPDFSTAGAVKTGEVEMVAAVALKATKAAAVMRKIKVG